MSAWPSEPQHEGDQAEGGNFDKLRLLPGFSASSTNSNNLRRSYPLAPCWVGGSSIGETLLVRIRHARGGLPGDSSRLSLHGKGPASWALPVLLPGR